MVAAAQCDAALIGEGHDVVGVDVAEQKTDDAGATFLGPNRRMFFRPANLS